MEEQLDNQAEAEHQTEGQHMENATEDELLGTPAAAECRARVLWGEKTQLIKEQLELNEEPVFTPEQIDFIIKDALQDRKDDIKEAGLQLIKRGAFCFGGSTLVLIIFAFLPFNTSYIQIIAIIVFTYGLLIGGLGYRRYKTQHVNGDATNLTGILG